MALKVFRAIKSKATSAILKSLHVEELTADNIRDLSFVGQMAIFVSDSKSGWLPCDGRIISYASDSTPGFIQTIYKELVLSLKAEANGDTNHPYYVANEFQAKLPNKNEFDSFPLGVPLPLMWDPAEGLPDGFLTCEGQGLDTTTYADLFAKIGYTHGGSGSTFNLPDLRETVPVGTGTRGSGVTAHDTYDVGEFKDDQMQQITGSFESEGLFAAPTESESGALSRGISGTSLNEAETGSTTRANMLIAFDSADSPDARTGTTTRTKQIGAQYIMRVTQSPKTGEYWMVKY